MAGPAITKALEARDYDEFHRLVHDFSEQHLLPQLVAVTSRCEMLEKLAAQKPMPRPLGDPAMLDATRAITGLRIVERAREYLWPRADVQKDYQTINRERLAPYDGNAWDRFFSGLVDVILPPLEACLAQSQQISMLIDLRMGPNPDKAEIALREIPLAMIKGCKQVRAALKPSYYEAIVAAWLDRRGES